MREERLPHPDADQLLAYSDGELPARTAAEVRAHIEGCWQCRADLLEMQRVIGECVKYRADLAAQVTAPEPWPDLERQFEAVDAALARESRWQRAARFFQMPMRQARRWAPVVAALAIVWVVVDQLRDTPSVRAAELLQKAVAAADRRPAKTRRLQIRTSTRSFTLVKAPGKQLAAVAEAEPVGALFEAAHYSWDDPLSARSYQAWRNQLSEKRDEVAGERISTSTESGELAEASLTFRTEDLEPVEGRFEFRNHEWVEIREIAESPAAPLESAEKSEPQHTETVDASERPAIPAAPATAHDELQTLAALHQLGADLGEPIEVERASGKVLVSGVGIPQDRQRQIQDMLGSRANVVVRFSGAEAPATQTAEAGAGVRGATPASGLRSRIENQLGGQPNLEQLARQVLEMSDAMMARAYALKRLAEQMPQGVEPELRAQDRALLLDLDRDHLTIFERQAAEIETALTPVLRSLGAPDAGAGGGLVPSQTWQAASEDLFQAARRLDKQLAQMLGAAPEDGDGEQLPAQVRASLTQVRARAAICERVTAQALAPEPR